MNHNKDEPKDEKMALVFKYISLAIGKKREKKGNGELAEIRKKLGLSHEEIIRLAAQQSIH